MSKDKYSYPNEQYLPEDGKAQMQIASGEDRPLMDKKEGSRLTWMAMKSNPGNEKVK